ncbi:MAG TPA: hypothetical protein VGL46_05045 [Pseudonocardiaceae bacterium]|jgi:hypothetical protein
MAYTDTAVQTAGIAFQGVWIHDPADPIDTVRQFVYGKATRSATIALETQGHNYAGRVYPVYDYGDYQNDQFPVSLDVPFGATWAADIAALQTFAEYRQTLVIRDNRGRVLYGVMTAYSEKDEEWGTTVSFTFIRVDQDTVTVTV